jgi:hypothetical protein
MAQTRKEEEEKIIKKLCRRRRADTGAFVAAADVPGRCIHAPMDNQKKTLENTYIQPS